MVPPKPVAVHSNEAILTTAALPAMDAAHLTMTQAAKLRPSPTVPGSMEAAVKMWLQVGNIQKLQQVGSYSTNHKEVDLKTSHIFSKAVLDGYGWLLQDQLSRLPHVNKFLRRVPEYQVKQLYVPLTFTSVLQDAAREAILAINRLLNGENFVQQ